MSYVTELELVQNDYGYDLEFELTDAEGDAVDLTGATAIKVFIHEVEASVAKVVATCTVTDAVNGLCKYTVQDGDFDEGDKDYVAEVEATFTGKVATATGVSIHVKKEAPETT